MLAGKARPLSSIFASFRPCARLACRARCPRRSRFLMVDVPGCALAGLASALGSRTDGSRVTRQGAQVSAYCCGALGDRRPSRAELAYLGVTVSPSQSEYERVGGLDGSILRCAEAVEASLAPGSGPALEGFLGRVVTAEEGHPLIWAFRAAGGTGGTGGTEGTGIPRGARAVGRGCPFQGHSGKPAAVLADVRAEGIAVGSRHAGPGPGRYRSLRAQYGTVALTRGG